MIIFLQNNTMSLSTVEPQVKPFTQGVITEFVSSKLLPIYAQNTSHMLQRYPQNIRTNVVGYFIALCRQLLYHKTPEVYRICIILARYDYQTKQFTNSWHFQRNCRKRIFFQLLTIQLLVGLYVCTSLPFDLQSKWQLSYLYQGQ